MFADISSVQNGEYWYSLVNMDATGPSQFTRRFSKALQGVMKENGITLRHVAAELGRSAGFVSEHTNGSAAPDTDLIDAVAALIVFPDGQSCRTEDLVSEIVRRLNTDMATQMFQTIVEATEHLATNPSPPGGGWLPLGDVPVAPSQQDVGLVADGGHDLPPGTENGEGFDD